MSAVPGKSGRVPVRRQLKAEVPVSPAPLPRRRVGFWIVTATLGLFLCAASAPSPLYGLYAADWHFFAVTLTGVFAVYALTLVVTLLAGGPASDTVGRRPVIMAGLVTQCASMALFLTADGAGWLFAARATQGAATGLVTAAGAAAIIDLQPADRPGLGPLVNAVTPAFGLAAGALAAGALVQYGPDPTRLVYAILLVGFLLIAGTLPAVPEPVRARSRPRLALRVGVEKAARPAFLAATPCLIATWALGGLYFSLGPSIALTLQHSANRLTGSSVITLLAGVGGLAALSVRAWSPRRAMLAGCFALGSGVAITTVAIATTSPWPYYLGTAIAGLGFGTAFLGAFRTLAALATPGRRGDLLSAIYLVAYLAFSLPALIAGLAVTNLGLTTTAFWYGIVIAVLAVAAIPLTMLTTADPASSRQAPGPPPGNRHASPGTSPAHRPGPEMAGGE